MTGWYIFTYLLGAFSCLCVLGWRSRDYEPDEDDGFCWEEDTKPYENRCAKCEGVNSWEKHSESCRE